MAAINHGPLTEAESYAFLEALRWPNGITCPHCHHHRVYFLQPQNGTTRRKTRTGSLSSRRVWKCARCRMQFSALTRTSFQGSKIPADVLVAILAQGPKTGTSIRNLTAQFPINYSTARDLLQKIRREPVKKEPKQPMINLYLDVDGVLNPCFEDNPEWGQWTAMNTVDYYNERFYLHLSREMGRVLQSLPITIVWLTTWVQDDRCNSVVARYFGWKGIRCLPDNPSTEKKYRWWKLDSILSEENIHNTPFIWIDDDLNSEKEEVEFFFGDRDDVLLICPETEIGITRAHIRQIETFVEKYHDKGEQ